MSRGEAATDVWRDEDGPSDREVDRFLDRLAQARVDHPDRQWTSVTVAYLDELRAAVERARFLEGEVRRLRLALRAALSRVA